MQLGHSLVGVWRRRATSLSRHDATPTAVAAAAAAAALLLQLTSDGRFTNEENDYYAI